MTTVTELNDAGRRGPYAKTARVRGEILDAATTVFGTHGYHGGSLRDISRELNLSLTSITHHFGSKYELLEAVLERADNTTDGNQAFDFDAACRSHGVVAATLERVRSSVDRPELLRLFAILSAEASSPSHPAHEWFIERYQRKSSELAAAFVFDQNLGRISTDQDPELLARLLLATWDGIQLQWLIDPRSDMNNAMLAFLSRQIPESVHGVN
jgi:AcrR family transcriptional regulator